MFPTLMAMDYCPAYPWKVNNCDPLASPPPRLSDDRPRHLTFLAGRLAQWTTVEFDSTQCGCCKHIRTLLQLWVDSCVVVVVAHVVVADDDVVWIPSSGVGHDGEPLFVFRPVLYL